MNEVYTLKYCLKNPAFIAVAALSFRIKKSSHRVLNAISMPLIISTSLLCSTDFVVASLVSSDIPYQTFRDFAENRGRFKAGSHDIVIYDKKGNAVGILDKAPMIDFSSINRDKLAPGVATLIAPQYIASVAHNRGYKEVGFGDAQYLYQLVARNNLNGEARITNGTDFHVPRLNKLVTEVAPMEVTNESRAVGVYSNRERYTAFYRVGSGMQYIRNKEGEDTFIYGAYSYLTGGTLGVIERYNAESLLTRAGDIFNPLNGPLASFALPGDSGSGLFAYDSWRNKWVLVAVQRFYSGIRNVYNGFTTVPKDFIEAQLLKDSDPTIHTTGKEGLNWSFNATTGVGKLQNTIEGIEYSMHGIKDNDLNAGKNLIFEAQEGESGKIVLQDSINQGAGTLTFRQDYSVSSDNNATWIGGGLDISSNATVEWGVNGKKGDNLHKIGMGTLLINAKGKNEGGLRVGDGTVILKQQADKLGHVQAFSHININSGRARVILGDSRQVNPNNIVWGYRGGMLDVNGNSLVFNQLNAADFGAILINTPSKMANITLKPETIVAANDNKRGRMFHGQLLGNLNIINSLNTESMQKMIFDGAIHVTGSLTQKYGRLTFQGHPVIHAYNSQAVVDKLIAQGDSSGRTQPTSFTQDDWENRDFRLSRLNLTNVDFGLARNATLDAVINAYHSKVTLGDSRVFIDKKDGDGVPPIVEEGQSIARLAQDKSLFRGSVFLYDDAELTINELFSAKISSYASKTYINSAETIFTGNSHFENSILQLNENAQVLATNGLFSNKDIVINNAKFYLHTMPTLRANNLSTEFYTAQNWTLQGKSALLSVGAFSVLRGNINADDNATITIGDKNSTLKPYSMMNYAERYGFSYLDYFRNVWNGRLDAPKANLSLYETRWGINGHSRVERLSLENSLIGFVETGRGFSTLTVDHLVANNSGISFRYSNRAAYKLVINHSATGQNNVLYVEFYDVPYWWSRLNIPLINAPVETNANLFKTAESIVGFTRYLPVVKVTTKQDRQEWILSGYKFVPYYSMIHQARSFLNITHGNFLSEVNNLNKRMGELRNIAAAAGAWARITNSSGSGAGGYKDRYTLLQMGVDRQENLENARLFTGITVTYTDSKAEMPIYHGKTDSVGFGVYATTLFNSGAYLDLIAKYVHHNNRYDLYLSGAGSHHFNSHSLYAGAELGYRYAMSKTLFIEPQAELVWGHIQGNRFNWVDNNVAVSMRRDSTQPLIGRTGVVLGKTLEGKAWHLTTRVGLHYEFDLTNSATTHFKDEFSYLKVKGQKDDRMLLNVGINAEIAENKRFGLEAGTSVFGKYNINHELNVNFRYSF